MGSPAKLMAACLGVVASTRLVWSALGVALYPVSIRCCSLMQPSIMSLGSFQFGSLVSFHLMLWSPLWARQQKTQPRVQLKTEGVICRHWWLFIP